MEAAGKSVEAMREVIRIAEAEGCTSRAALDEAGALTRARLCPRTTLLDP